MKISCTILTKNASKTLKKTLNSLTFIDEIILLDSGSSDATLEIASKYPNVKIFKHPFLGFGEMHNLATSYAKYDWILSIDSDEVIPDQAKEKFKSLILNPDYVYSLSFQNILFGKKIRFSGWFPDRKLRLYNRKSTSFTNAKVHETIITQGLKVIDLPIVLEHYSYLEVSDLLRKMQTYSDLFVTQNRLKKSSVKKACLHGIFAFFKTYFLKLGFLDGGCGLIIACYQAQTAFYKYLKLWDASRTSKID